jgi:hypothetical protein
MGYDGSMQDVAGVVTSAMIVAVCLAALHSLVDLRRQQAEALGLVYWNRARLIVVCTLAVLGFTYFASLALVVAVGSQ